MHPIFPGLSQDWQDAIQPACDYILLPKLAQHLHVLLLSACFYHSIYIISSIVSPYFSHYRALDRRTKVNWDIHAVSMVQAIVILYLIYRVYVYDVDIRKDKIFGFSNYAGDVYATACGYFLWDALISTYYISWFGFGFVFHGIASLQIFLFSYAPFLQYWGPAFLLFEASTPFLNIHWYLDKVGMTGSRLQLVNGLLLLITFFLVRGVWGWYMAYDVFSSLYYARERVNWTLSSIYFFSNMSLNFLNIYWFKKMIDALRKRKRKAS